MSSLSLAPALFDVLSPHKTAIALGLGASSFLFWGNVALAEMGVMHMVQQQRRERLGVRPVQALQLWETFYDRGLVGFLSSAFAASASFYVAAGRLDSSPPARTLLYVAAGLNLSIAPFTLLFIAPTNSSLKALLRSAEGNSKPGRVTELRPEEDTIALQGLDRWSSRSAIRTCLAGVGWVAAVLALLVQ